MEIIKCNIKAMKVYFYFGVHADPVRSYHDMVCLAEGFGKMGIDCVGDRIYFSGHRQVVRYDENIGQIGGGRWNDQSLKIVIFHHALYQFEPNADSQIMQITSVPNRSFQCIFIDAMDGVRTHGFERGARSCDLVLKCHFNRMYKYPENFIPWQFGLSNRMLEFVHPSPFEERSKVFLVNFRVKHQLRDYINEKIRPIVEKYLEWDNSIYVDAGRMTEDNLLYWKQTGGRHDVSYYDRLSVSECCACYGGVFVIPYGNRNKYTARVVREINRIIPIFKWDRVRQWDSWRLWEAWAAGCCVVHIDLEKYGCVMPEMPQNGVHYVGIDLDNLKAFEDIMSNQDKVKAIAANGRQFVLDHYIPEKTANRLLKLLNIPYAPPLLHHHGDVQCC